MNTSSAPEYSQNDALFLVALRNIFYKTRMHYVLFLWLLSVLGILVLTSIAIYLIKHPTQPIYFPADQAGKLIKEVPVTKANMSDAAVAAWIVKAVEAAYSYDFVNYRSELQNAQQYFFDNGWQEYMKGLTQSGNLIGLTERKLIFRGKVVAPPVLIRKVLYNNSTLAWKFQVPVLNSIYYPPSYGENTKSANAWIVTLVVFRRNILENGAGLGITQMNATPAVE